MPSFPGWPGLAHAGTPPGSPSVARDQCKGGGEFWGDVFGHALGMLWEMNMHAELIKLGTLLDGLQH